LKPFSIKRFLNDSQSVRVNRANARLPSQNDYVILPSKNNHIVAINGRKVPLLSPGPGLSELSDMSGFVTETAQKFTFGAVFVLNWDKAFNFL